MYHYLCPSFVNTCSKGSDETALLRRLSSALIALVFDKYQNLISWLFCLIVLMSYIPVNIVSIMMGHFPVFLHSTSSKQRIKCLAQGHNTVPPVSLELATLLPRI